MRLQPLALVLSDVVGRQKPFPAEHRDTAQKTCCHLHLSHKEGQEGFHSADQVLGSNPVVCSAPGGLVDRDPLPHPTAPHYTV
ncbi:unnamed protein product [Arctogadus glacialis]